MARTEKGNTFSLHFKKQSLLNINISYFLKVYI